MKNLQDYLNNYTSLILTNDWVFDFKFLMWNTSIIKFRSFEIIDYKEVYFSYFFEDILFYQLIKDEITERNTEFNYSDYINELDKQFIDDNIQYGCWGEQMMLFHVYEVSSTKLEVLSKFLNIRPIDIKDKVYLGIFKSVENNSSMMFIGCNYYRRLDDREVEENK